jgi:hypothetical protein
MKSKIFIVILIMLVIYLLASNACLSYRLQKVTDLLVVAYNSIDYHCEDIFNAIKDVQ